MKKKSRSYLVLIYDEPCKRTFVQMVNAVTGFDAGAYVLSFDELGVAREGGGYKVMAVFTSSDLMEFACSLKALREPVAPRFKQSDVKIEDDILISD